MLIPPLRIIREMPNRDSIDVSVNSTHDSPVIHDRIGLFLSLTLILIDSRAGFLMKMTRLLLTAPAQLSAIGR
jgi:hypothetical protein